MKHVSRRPALQPAILENNDALPAVPFASYVENYLPAAVSSPTIRIHKSWRAAFIVLLVLLKVLLGFCVYYYIKAEMISSTAALQPALHATP